MNKKDWKYHTPSFTAQKQYGSLGVPGDALERGVRTLIRNLRYSTEITDGGFTVPGIGTFSLGSKAAESSGDEDFQTAEEENEEQKNGDESADGYFAGTDSGAEDGEVRAGNGKKKKDSPGKRKKKSVKAAKAGKSAKSGSGGRLSAGASQRGQNTETQTKDADPEQDEIGMTGVRQRELERIFAGEAAGGSQGGMPVGPGPSPETLRQALIWAEILGDPVSRKRQRKRVSERYGDQGHASRG